MANQTFPYQRHVNPTVNGNVVCGAANHRRYKADAISQRKLRQIMGDISHILGGCDNQSEMLLRLGTCERRLRRIVSNYNTTNRAPGA